jgi:hypothetical protein
MTMLGDRPQATLRSVAPVSGAERVRLAEIGAGTPEWRDWGPHLSERALPQTSVADSVVSG